MYLCNVFIHQSIFLLWFLYSHSFYFPILSLGDFRYVDYMYKNVLVRFRKFKNIYVYFSSVHRFYICRFFIIYDSSYSDINGYFILRIKLYKFNLSQMKILRASLQSQLKVLLFTIGVLINNMTFVWQ